MRIMAIDSSSVCTGVVIAEIDGRNLTKVGCAPVIPQKFDVSTLGYMKTKKKYTNKKGVSYQAYTIPGESYVVESVAKKRNVQVRHEQNNFKLNNIGSQLSMIIKNIQPDIIVIEKNKTFNSVLTSALLAEVMGLVEGVAAASNIPLHKYTVEEVRKSINAAKLVKLFAMQKTPEELSHCKDVTKEAIQDYMMAEYSKYGFKPSTLDESDACLIFHYWYENIFKGD